jgi:hypothetical protein
MDSNKNSQKRTKVTNSWVNCLHPRLRQQVSLPRLDRRRLEVNKHTNTITAISDFSLFWVASSFLFVSWFLGQYPTLATASVLAFSEFPSGFL